MSDFQPAFLFLMANEDSAHEYAEVPDVGGFAISGINSASWPSQFADIAAIQQAMRGPAVEAFYLDNFWNPMRLAGLGNQDVANRVLDEGVNAGSGTSCKMLQQAANACGASLVMDGAIGPHTLAAVNAIQANQLLAAFRAARAERYRKIVQENPNDERYLAQWLARAAQ